MRKYLLSFAVLLAIGFGSIAISVPGCTSLKDIPLFSANARLLNRVASCEELEIEVNNMLASLVANRVLTQAEVDKTFTPAIDKAEAIWKATREVARGRSTTQPSGTLEDAKALLLSVRDVLKTLEKQP